MKPWRFFFGGMAGGMGLIWIVLWSPMARMERTVKTFETALVAEKFTEVSEVAVRYSRAFEGDITQVIRPKGGGSFELVTVHWQPISEQVNHPQKVQTVQPIAADVVMKFLALANSIKMREASLQTTAGGMLDSSSLEITVR